MKQMSDKFVKGFVKSMDAYAELNEQRIRDSLECHVVLDGLRGKYLRERFPALKVVAAHRKKHAINDLQKDLQPTREECISRDYAQIKNLHQAGPIAMADYAIVNRGTKRRITRRS